ncbi:hypothetical protein TNCV_576601 [Trichonephila clavipes]|nr:hypothetical protein TNCV_576601 [Trichonephila clavipes]
MIDPGRQQKKSTGGETRPVDVKERQKKGHRLSIGRGSHGLGLMAGVVSDESCVRILMPLKTRRVEQPLHIKSVETQSVL